MHLDRCICSFIPRLDLKTRVSLLIHAKELKRTTNTGRLAVHALVNSRLYVRGAIAGPPDLSELISLEYESYVLFPSEGAQELNTIKPMRPVQLIVADGNWRQAGKVHKRHAELSRLPRVKVSRRIPARFHLRKEHFKEGLSTLESIALALAAIEGESVGESLMALYQAKLSATLQGRGVPELNGH
jgi:DTW domain-containing protein